MKDEQLLSVMFLDAAEFRERLFDETLRHLRRRRRARQAGSALLALVIVALAIWWSLPRPTALHSPSQDGSLQIVQTSPLSVGQLATTRPDSVLIISSDPSSLALLGDDQLLDLVPGETKLLVWHAPHQAELVILGP